MDFTIDRFYSDRMRVPYPRPTSGPFKYFESRDSPAFMEVDDIGRCDHARLIFLVTYTTPPPLLTKKGIPKVHQPPPHKDETLRFYRAQCQHYGLKPKSDKKGAKKALLAYANANGGRFVVPPAVEQIQSKLAAEFKITNAEYESKVAAIDVAEEKAREGRMQKQKRAHEAAQSSLSKKQKPNKKHKGTNPKTPNTSGGAYTVSAPAISDQWDTPNDMILRLCQSSKTRHIWGSFHFGVIEGTFRSEELSQSGKGKIVCHWRGRETGEGETSYDPKNVLEFEFISEKVFKGHISVDFISEDVKIVGTLDEQRTKNEVFAKNIRGWKDEYRSINEDTYESASRMRWGGWHEDTGADKAADSDTTEAEVSDEGDFEGSGGVMYGGAY